MKQRTRQEASRVSICAALLALATAVPAFGQAIPPPVPQNGGNSWSTASLLGYTLEDLSPGDGLTPSVSFSPGKRGGENVVGTTKDGNPGPILDQAPLTSSGSSTASTDGAGSTSWLSGREAAAASFAGDGLFAHGNAYFTEQFVLSPHSRLTLSFTGDAGGTQDEAFWQMAFVHLEVFIEHNAEGYGSWQSGGGWHSDYPSPGPEVSFIVETGALGSAGHFMIGASSSIYARPASPVPEPGAWTLALAGLACLYWRQRFSIGKSVVTLAS